VETLNDLLPPLLRERIAAGPEVGWALLFFVLALPLETLVGTGHRVSWTERLRNVGAMLIHFAVGGALLFLLMANPIGIRFMQYPMQPRWAALENPWLWALAMVFIVDGLFYAYHRAQHRNALLWRIHKLHHTEPTMNITTSRRTHFLERPLQFVLLVLPPLWILGYNAQGFEYAAWAGLFFLFWSHLDVRLPLGPLTPIVVGPQLHRLHHSAEDAHRDVNFAQVFPLFDVLGDTYRRPGDDEYPVTGIAGCASVRDRWRPLVW
jgi:sterol desaturase/sphingolipid hydroxylase (fatty acid hydroxylase superfamily)